MQFQGVKTRLETQEFTLLQVLFAIKLQKPNTALLWAGLRRGSAEKKSKAFYLSDNFLSDNCQQKVALGARKSFEIWIFPEVKVSVNTPRE